MSEKKEFIGISFNKYHAQGKILENPVIIGEDQAAYMLLETHLRKMDANGQWVDATQKIPLYVMDPNKVKRTVKPYIQANRKLYVNAYYDSWVDDNGNAAHGMIVTNIILGDKPYVPKDVTDMNPSLPSN